MYQRLLKHRGSIIQPNHLCKPRQLGTLKSAVMKTVIQAVEPNSAPSHGYGPPQSRMLSLLPTLSGGTSGTQGTKGTEPSNQSVPNIRMGNQQGFHTHIETEDDIHHFVLFGVKRNRRTLELAQIDTAKYQDDSAFFCGLRENYRQLRGFVRYWFSIWQLSHCDFVKVNFGFRTAIFLWHS